MEKRKQAGRQEGMKIGRKNIRIEQRKKGNKE